MPTTSTTLRVATPFFLVALWFSAELVQGQNTNEPLQAMTKTIKWMEKLEHFDFEVTATTHNKSVSLVNPKNSSSIKRIEKFREFKCIDGTFYIARSEGLIMLDSRGGVESKVELSRNHCMHGNKDEAETISFDNWQERLSSSSKCEDGSPCDAVARGFDWGQVPLFNMLQPSDSSNLEVVLQRVAEQGSFTTTDINPARSKRKKEFRFKHRFPGGTTFGYVITVASSGPESGMVVNYRRLKLKDTEKDMPFISDDQCVKEVVNSSSIVWKVVENRTGNWVVPSRILQKSTEGPYSVIDREWAFTWNSIDEPDVEKMSVVACKEICKEFTSDIDGALGR